MDVIELIKSCLISNNRVSYYHKKLKKLVLKNDDKENIVKIKRLTKHELLCIREGIIDSYKNPQLIRLNNKIKDNDKFLNELDKYHLKESYLINFEARLLNQAFVIAYSNKIIKKKNYFSCEVVKNAYRLSELKPVDDFFTFSYLVKTPLTRFGFSFTEDNGFLNIYIYESKHELYKDHALVMLGEESNIDIELLKALTTTMNISFYPKEAMDYGELKWIERSYLPNGVIKDYPAFRMYNYCLPSLTKLYAIRFNYYLEYIIKCIIHLRKQKINLDVNYDSLYEFDLTKDKIEINKVPYEVNYVDLLPHSEYDFSSLEIEKSTMIFKFDHYVENFTHHHLTINIIDGDKNIVLYKDEISIESITDFYIFEANLYNYFLKNKLPELIITHDLFSFYYLKSKNMNIDVLFEKNKDIIN